VAFFRLGFVYILSVQLELTRIDIRWLIHLCRHECLLPMSTRRWAGPSTTKEVILLL